MKMSNFTPQQTEAIQTITKNVAVSAGAGSGKTRVLVERFIYILQQAKAQQIPYLETTDILAITFTRKAASEMKSRIRKRLNELLAQEGQSDFWHKQMQTLERAQIATIHSLCSRILRENPVEAQLDPSFIVAEDFESADFIAQCVQRYLRQELAQDNAALRELVTAYGVTGFVGQVNSLISNLPEIVVAGDLTLPYKASKEKIAAQKNDLCLVLDDLVLRKDDLTKAKTKGREHLDKLAAALENIKAGIMAETTDFTELDVIILAIKGPRGEFKSLVDEAKGLRNSIALGEINELAVPLVSAWQKILNDLYTFMQQQKQKSDFLDFDDLELLAVKLLRENEQVRQKYHERFRYIMVDEFQDTNDRQRELIYLLCGNDADKLQDNKLFIVGDPKQSIYRFRGADVGVFARVRAEIAESGGCCLSLSQNFRSADKVLATCNATFRPLLGEDKTQNVFFEELAANREGDFVPLLLKVVYDEDTKEQSRMLEAEAVAQKMRELHKTGTAYGEMAVLLRAMTNCDILTTALQRQGVPYIVIDGKGFYERQEVLDLLNLMTVLHNHYRNLELAGVLRSPYFGLNDETLTKLFLWGDNLWASLQLAKASDFNDGQGALILRAAKILQELHAYAALAALPELWQKIWSVLAVDAVLSMQEHGAGKLANAQKLRHLAEEYCVARQATLGDWLDYVARVCKAEVKETAANLDASDAVQILTIHKSKGLEFKTVFLPMLDSASQADRSEIKYLPEIGLGIKIPIGDKQPEPTGVLTDIKELDKKLELAERIRQLYVAMTRAENTLIMSGIVKIDKKTEDRNKTLWEKNWLEQLLIIFADGKEINIEECDMRNTIPEAVTFANEQIVVTAKTEQEIAPVPAYLTSGHTHFTASALQTYLYCPRQYFYQQFLHLPEFDNTNEMETEKNAQTEKLPAYITGLIVHRALELYRGDVQTAFERALDEHAPGCKAQFAHRLLERYVASDLFQSLPVERERELKFSLPTEKGLIIEGVIDCLAYNSDGTLLLVDYKTGAPSAGEMQLGYAYQLALYKEAAEKILERKVSCAQLHFLQDLSIWNLPEGGTYFADALKLCEKIAAKSKESEFNCACGTKCAHCPYNYLCPQK